MNNVATIVNACLSSATSKARTLGARSEGTRRHHGRSDFDCDIARQADAKGDRVKLGMTGKFLPFKDDGAKGNEVAYGLKEE
ncbi:MAG: hypothetical protein NTU64_17975 [Hyphomicrobiales bacterium]|nr:hypothetical protein [Hyphomicrobiales bacterium]